ncbi:MAG: sulfatase [Acidimicrobiia bacterium]|nr:sulfatase [Acidimicrobiia bacterium]
MNRRTFLQTALAAPLAAASRKPNIVLLFADDLGYGGTGPYGERDFPTPHIDSMARNGVRFTNGYVSCPVCSPTRAGMMTGRYQQRFGHELNPGPADLALNEFGLPLTETTIADRLKSLGYATGLMGKWHLGYQPEFHPMKRGFHEFFGFLGGAHSYNDALADTANPILRGTERVNEKEYLTDALGREAISFIDRHKAGPFFLYLSFNAVHAPMQAMEKYTDRFAGIADRNRRIHAGMMAAMDDAIGGVLTTLQRNKLMEDTLIFFISDNGGPTPVNTSRNTPLRGFKGQVYEGGIRVPFLMQWNGKIRKGSVYEQPAIALDVLPTAVAAAGGSIDPNWKLDGVDLMPHVTGKNKKAPHETLYWRFGARSAIRKGNMKLLKEGGEAELYDLAKDVGEQNNLAATRAEAAADLQRDFEAWNSQLMAPRWRNPRNDRPQKGRKKAESRFC